MSCVGLSIRRLGRGGLAKNFSWIGFSAVIMQSDAEGRSEDSARCHL